MNTRFLKWLLTVTVMCCLSFVAANVTAKKPIKPPEPEPNLCLSTGLDFPAFAFMRETEGSDDWTMTFYVSSAGGECVRTMFSAPVMAPPFNYLEYSYSADENLGRVIWSMFVEFPDGFLHPSIWLQEFQLSGTNDVSLLGPPVLLVADGTYSALSDDGHRLAVSGAFTESGLVRWGVSVFDVDSCTGTCSFETDGDIAGNCDGYGGSFCRKIAWDPSAERIYVTIDGSSEVDYHDSLRVFENDSAGNWQNRLMVNPGKYPEYHRISGVASGYDTDGFEKLALEARVDEARTCLSIWVLDVEGCELGNCSAETSFYGRSPSWNVGGEILHERALNEVRRNKCFDGSVGLWDGGPSIPSLMNGLQPNAR